MLTRIRIEAVAPTIGKASEELNAMRELIERLGDTSITDEVYEGGWEGNERIFKGRIVLALPLEGYESKIGLPHIRYATDKIGERPGWRVDENYDLQVLGVCGDPDNGSVGGATAEENRLRRRLNERETLLSLIHPELFEAGADIATREADLLKRLLDDRNNPRGDARLSLSAEELTARLVWSEKAKRPSADQSLDVARDPA